MEPHNTFVVRFWWRLRDKQEQPPSDWYGRIEHLQSGEGASFREPGQLLAFIQRYVSLAVPAGAEPTLDDQAQDTGKICPGHLK